MAPPSSAFLAAVVTPRADPPFVSLNAFRLSLRIDETDRGIRNPDDDPLLLLLLLRSDADFVDGVTAAPSVEELFNLFSLPGILRRYPPFMGETKGDGWEGKDRSRAPACLPGD